MRVCYLENALFTWIFSITVGATETAIPESSTVSSEGTETTTGGSTEASSESSSEATTEVASTTEAGSSEGTTPGDTDGTTQETTTGNCSLSLIKILMFKYATMCKNVRSCDHPSITY